METLLLPSCISSSQSWRSTNIYTAMLWESIKRHDGHSPNTAQRKPLKGINIFQVTSLPSNLMMYFGESLIRSANFTMQLGHFNRHATALWHVWPNAPNYQSHFVCLPPSVPPAKPSLRPCSEYEFFPFSTFYLIPLPINSWLTGSRSLFCEQHNNTSISVSHDIYLPPPTRSLSVFSYTQSWHNQMTLQ